MKMVSISGGAKILPKPTQPLYVVTASTTPLTMVTRTVPAGTVSTRVYLGDRELLNGFAKCIVHASKELHLTYFWVL